MKWNWTGCGVSAALICLVSGCGGGGATNRSAATEPVNAGLGQFLSESSDAGDDSGIATHPNDIQKWLEADAAILPSLARGEAPSAPVLSTPAPMATNLGSTVSIENELPLDSAGEIPSAKTNAAPSKPSASINESPAVVQSRLIQELATLLRREVRESTDPLRQYAALAALELLEPGVVPDPTSIPTLTPREVDLLSAWRDLFRNVDEELSSASGDISALASSVNRLATRMAEWETLKIADARLCSRVEGFGQYTALPGPKMLAGRRNPAIVYVQLDHFTHRAATGDNGEAGYIVELAQELSLYHDADGLLAWRQPEQLVRDFSRERRRDFFVVQRIDLPETLSVGAYRLKITMRDKATGAIAERILPIELVADVALVRAQ